jgi:sulfoxide reductase heme-binding subunit YedZ
MVLSFADFRVEMLQMRGRAIPYLKTVVHLLCLLPVMKLVELYRSGALAAKADPVNYITHFTGYWALWFLLGGLAVTPVRRLHAALAWMIRFRRMLGLYAFFYATLHLLTYVLLFSGYDVPAAMEGVRAGHWMQPWVQLQMIWPTMLDDLQKRRFIQVGLFAWVILLALAMTSPQRVMRAMGGKKWQWLHRMIYVAGIAGCVHYWWLVKAGVRTPLPMTAVLVGLLVWRVVWVLRGRRARGPALSPARAVGVEVVKRVHSLRSE